MENTKADKLKKTGAFIIRYGLVAILLWVGLLKFFAYEAEGIKPLVENSFLMSWGYDLMSVHGFSDVIGFIEIVLGLLIATRSFFPRLSALGSIGAIFMFAITLTFMVTTPGIWQKGYGFPFPSPMPGQFLFKDLILLGAAVWTAGEALVAVKLQHKTKPAYG